MTTFNDCLPDHVPDLITRLRTPDDAGVDPAFDSDMEELDRRFAELRLTYCND